MKTQDGLDESQYRRNVTGNEHDLRVDTDPDPRFESQKLVSIEKIKRKRLNISMETPESQQDVMKPALQKDDSNDISVFERGVGGNSSHLGGTSLQ